MPHNNDQPVKNIQKSSLSRPVSMSSQDSEELSSVNSSAYDLTALEKDSEILARRAAKRYNKNYNTHSESIVEKFISWHRKKKVDKIKCSLESLFPKLKNSEVAVKNWLATVSERKEVAWLNGNALLNDMETQIVVYQKHLDFLDEVVNDIRQIDYDILKEVSELRIAFAFNQELLTRVSPNVGGAASVVKTGSRVLLIAIDPEPLPVSTTTTKSRISQEFEQEVVTSGASDEGDVDHTTRPPDSPVPQATPAVWQGFASGPAVVTSPVPAVVVVAPAVEQRPFGMSITALFTAIGSGSSHGKATEPKTAVAVSASEADLARRLRDINSADCAANIAVNRNGRISPKTATSTAANSARSQLVSPTSGASRVDASGDPVLTWDGEESKRKSLTLSCVSLQSLKLGDTGRTDSPTTSKRSSWGLSSSSSDKSASKSSNSNNFLGTNFSRGRSGTTSSINSAEGERRGSWGKRESDTAGALLQKRGAWSSPLSVLSPRTAESALGPRTTPSNGFRSESSSDESCNSLSDGDAEEGDEGAHNDHGVMLGDMDSFSSSEGSHSADSADSPSKKKKQRGRAPSQGSSSGSSDPVSNGKSLPRKLSLQKLLQKVDSNEISAAHCQLLSPAQRGSGGGDDPDQVEMGQRIKKCLALKDTLKSVLCTVQCTQDTETSALRKMKKLRNELKVICSTENDPSVVRDGDAGGEGAFYSLCQQKLLNETNSGNENSSGSNSMPSSSNNLHGLGYVSDHGSDHGSHDSYSHLDATCLGMRLDGPGHGGSARPRATPPIAAHNSSANIPIIPPAHHITPSQSAAVAVSGVAAFSFMTSATTGSDEGVESGAVHEERLSIGSNSSFGDELDFQEAALECVDGLKSLIQQEAEAKVKLAKLASLINAASTINQQLQLGVASVGSASGSK